MSNFLRLNPKTKIVFLILCILFPKRGTPKYVLLGEHDLANDKVDRPFRVEIAEKIPHPKFKRSAKYYDIALIRMAIRITFNRFQRPACLPYTYNPVVSNAIASGWGRSLILQYYFLKKSMNMIDRSTQKVDLGLYLSCPLSL